MVGGSGRMSGWVPTWATPAGRWRRRSVRSARSPGSAFMGCRVFATRPVGVVDQPDFLNAVVALDVPAGPGPESGAAALLLALKGLERAFGRQDRGRWGPRELDLDMLVFGRHRNHVERSSLARSDDPARAGAKWLDVPHVAAGERLFVLAPLADLAPGLVPPGWGATVESRRRERVAIEGADAVQAVATWDPTEGWRAQEPR